MVRFTIQVICAAFQRGYVRSSELTIEANSLVGTHAGLCSKSFTSQ